MNPATIKLPMLLMRTAERPTWIRPTSTSKRVCSYFRASWQARARTVPLPLPPSRRMSILRPTRLLALEHLPHRSGERRHQPGHQPGLQGRLLIGAAVWPSFRPRARPSRKSRSLRQMASTIVTRHAGRRWPSRQARIKSKEGSMRILCAASRRLLHPRLLWLALGHMARLRMHYRS